MRMRAWWFWVVVSVVGFGLLLGAYLHYVNGVEKSGFEDNLIFIGASEPNGSMEGLEYRQVLVRMEMADANLLKFEEIASELGEGTSDAYRTWAAKKIFPYASFKNSFGEKALESGRLPEEENEALAGFGASVDEKLIIKGREYKIVGRLKRDFTFVSNAFFAGWKESDIYDRDDDVQNAYFVKCSRKQLIGQQLTARLARLFPKEEFSVIIHLTMMGAANFWFYIAGLCIMLSGGTGAIITLYRLAGAKFRNTFLAGPLRAIMKYRRLLINLHIIVFGLCIAAMIAAYELPESQIIATAALRAQFESGVLAKAVAAYASGNVLWAAAVTFSVNFLSATVLTITLPSLIVPGCGLVILLSRSILLLAMSPAVAEYAMRMVPHSLVLLLEFEAYILASFFGLLVPIYLIQRWRGNIWARYKQAAAVNAKGLIIAAVILAAAALYEAAEVIFMVKVLN